jgi:hypothetical protein
MAEPKPVKDALNPLDPNDDFNRPMEGYEAVTEDEGYQIEFPDTGGDFFGTFTGVKELPLNPADLLEAKEKGGKETWTMVTFADKNGERCNMPSNYRMDEALKTLVEGDEVRIVHHGLKDIGGGRTLNRISVYRKTKK